MWWLGFFCGALNAVSYRLDGVAGIAAALLSLSVLFYVHCKLRTTALRCLLWFLFALSYYLVSLHWINGYLSQEYGDAEWIARGLWPLLIVLLSSSFLFVPLLLSRLSTLSTLIALPFLLTVMDILREHTSFSFPWLHPGYLLADIGFSGWLSAVGAVGGSLLVYIAAGALTWQGFNFRLCFRLWESGGVALLGIGLCLVAGNAVFKYVNHAEQSQSVSQIRMLHGNFAVTDKLSKNDVIERIQKYVSLSLQAPYSQLVIWPESSMSVPYQDVAAFVGESLAKLQHKNVVALWGGQWRNGQHMQNVVYRSDKANPIYYKQRLVPFGEYRPVWFADWFQGARLARGDDIQSMANTSHSYSFGDIEAVIAVCYESLYSDVFTSKLRDSSVNIAFLLSDVEWTQTPWVKQFLLKLAQVRAAEIGRSVIYVTNQGETALIGSSGQLLQRVETQRTQVLDVSAPLVTGETLYTRYGHQWLLWVSVLVVIVIRFIHFLKSKNYAIGFLSSTS